MVEHVVLFITRKKDDFTELLVLDHPYEGLSLIKGTIEEHEMPIEASHRVGFEQTLLGDLEMVFEIKSEACLLGRDQKCLKCRGNVYARASRQAAQWAHLPKGVQVTVVDSTEDFSQVEYVEFDDFNNPNMVTYRIKGWIENRHLTSDTKWHYYHFQTNTSKASWTSNVMDTTCGMKWVALKDVAYLTDGHMHHYQAVMDHFQTVIDSEYKEEV